MGRKNRNKRLKKLSKWDNINEEWGQSLVGLPMKVKGRWWAGIDKEDRNKFFNGHLEKYDKRISRWYLKIAGDDDLYEIWYDAVLQYADENHSMFRDFHLYNDPLPPPASSVVLDRTRTQYKATNKDDWTPILTPEEENDARNVDPIEFTGENEEFDVNITDEEIKSLKDDSGTIRFEKVLEWCLPRFDNGNGGTIGLFKWQAQQMSNYLHHLLIKELEEGEKQ